MSRQRRPKVDLHRPGQRLRLRIGRHGLAEAVGGIAERDTGLRVGEAEGTARPGCPNEPEEQTPGRSGNAWCPRQDSTLRHPL